MNIQSLKPDGKLSISQLPQRLSIGAHTSTLANGATIEVSDLVIACSEGSPESSAFSTASATASTSTSFWEAAAAISDLGLSGSILLEGTAIASLKQGLNRCGGRAG